MRSIFLFLSLMFLSLSVSAQSGKIEGLITDEINNDPIPFANVIIEGTTTGSTTDIDGKFQILDLDPGLYNIQVSYVGYEPKIIYEVQVTNARAAFVEIRLKASATQLETVEITKSVFNKTEESPVSLRTIGTAEIMRNPGGNRDISKVVQTLPGVASTVGFRNDILIRGGGPNENRFFLDGIEVPNINHFATQGASGGPVGMLNVNFIREVDVISGAFPSNRGNAMSSVFEFKQKDGNPDKMNYTFMMGSSDIGLTLDGPTGKNSSIIFSARRSYLQFLFQALKLPFLPTYNDAQLKYRIKLGKKDQLSIIGLGAYDVSELNPSANSGVTDQETFDRNVYILNNIPENKQWNYTIGANYQHFKEKSFQTIVLSRSQLNNKAIKYFDNDDSSPDNLLLDYVSEEVENKFRFENTYRNNGWKWNYGVNYEYATYSTNTFNRTVVSDSIVEVQYRSELNMNKVGLFAQASKSMFKERLVASLGLRTDMNDYSDDMNDPVDQFSPRLSLSYRLSPTVSVNFNTGRFYQLPPYTVLGYRDGSGTLVNKDNNIRYTRSDHLVAGIEFNSDKNRKFTLEGFYKWYSDYPLLLRDSISLANVGGDFGVVGNEPAAPISDGRAFGIEFLAQQRMWQGLYAIVSYTFVSSEFTDGSGEFKPSSWDFGHILNLVAAKQFNKNWELGVKWRYQGGGPYTPYDVGTSSIKEIWDVNQSGLPDNAQLNNQRLPASHGLDIRVDKRYFFDKWTLNIYLDIENLYAAEIESTPYLDVERDENGQPIEDPNDPSRYLTKEVRNISTTVLPSLGVMIEF